MTKRRRGKGEFVISAATLLFQQYYKLLKLLHHLAAVDLVVFQARHFDPQLSIQSLHLTWGAELCAALATNDTFTVLFDARLAPVPWSTVHLEKLVFDQFCSPDAAKVLGLY